MIDYDQAEGSFSVSKIQLIDLENAAFLPPGRCIQGMLAGNDNWRSPEAHFRAELNKPTDLFSFGAIVSRRRQEIYQHVANSLQLVHLRYPRPCDLRTGR